MEQRLRSSLAREARVVSSCLSEAYLPINQHILMAALWTSCCTKTPFGNTGRSLFKALANSFLSLLGKMDSPEKNMVL